MKFSICEATPCEKIFAKQKAYQEQRERKRKVYFPFFKREKMEGLLRSKKLP